ncbi:aspartate aminotransferase family protein [Gulosibacter macacae]|uniref:aspartate aminotransferase family protein n=1 Tax=Gulosibacter macacae TaxID=2488791 RepID=UPI001639DB2D|nr:aminotransferase class III-fold pyridoxal phosphate-dependent enzyme [Gulosibacter macacae]
MTASLAQRRQQVLGGTYRLFYDEPVEVASASGVWVTDVAGTRLLDAYNNVPVIGHSDPEVAAAVQAELLRANSHTRYLDREVVDYAERLLARFPAHLDRVAFTCSGSEANDLALQLATHLTGRRGIIVTEHAYHGTTAAVRAVSPSLVTLAGVADYVVTVPIPRDGSDAERAQEFAAAVDRAVAELCRRGLEPAAILVDTALTSDGIFAPAAFVSEGIRRAQASGALFIADEVQAGFCRTGQWWGFEHLDVAPDLVTLGKPMGNGLPIAAVVGPAASFDSFGAEYRYFNTFAGTAAPIAAARVVLDRLGANDTPVRVNALGERLRSGFAQAATDAGVGALVRGAGLMVGVDFAVGGVSPSRAAEYVRELVNELRRREVLVSHTGAHGEALKIRPPLVIDEAEIDELIGRFAAALLALPRLAGDAA